MTALEETFQSVPNLSKTDAPIKFWIGKRANAFARFFFKKFQKTCKRRFPEPRVVGNISLLLHNFYHIARVLIKRPPSERSGRELSTGADFVTIKPETSQPELRKL